MRWPPPSSACDTGAGALHQAIVEQTQDAIIFVDRDGIIRLWNRGAEIIFGYGAQEALGRSLNLIIPEKHRPAHHHGFHQAIELGQMRHDGRILTTRAQNKYGSRLYVDFSFGLLKDAAGATIGSFAIGRDCTTRYVEQAVKLAQAEAAAAVAKGLE